MAETTQTEYFYGAHEGETCRCGHSVEDHEVNPEENDRCYGNGVEQSTKCHCTNFATPN